jgi:hypothetical protein
MCTVCPWEGECEQGRNGTIEIEIDRKFTDDG